MSVQKQGRGWQQEEGQGAEAGGEGAAGSQARAVSRIGACAMPYDAYHTQTLMYIVVHD